MDADQLRELSTNAMMNHWPPHLGVNTDQEKIEYLARQLESAASNWEDVDSLQEKLDDAEENRDDAVNELSDVENCAGCALCEQHKKAKTQ